MKESLEKRAKLKYIFGFDVPIDMASSMIVRKLVIDIVKLDEKLKVPDGVSTRDYIEQKYGVETRKIVEEML